MSGWADFLQMSDKNYIILQIQFPYSSLYKQKKVPVPSPSPASWFQKARAPFSFKFGRCPGLTPRDLDRFSSDSRLDGHNVTAVLCPLIYQSNGLTAISQQITGCIAAILKGQLHQPVVTCCLGDGGIHYKARAESVI